jgi:hypothetical protein
MPSLNCACDSTPVNAKNRSVIEEQLFTLNEKLSNIFLKSDVILNILRPPALSPIDECCPKEVATIAGTLCDINGIASSVLENTDIAIDILRKHLGELKLEY